MKKVFPRILAGFLTICVMLVPALNLEAFQYDTAAKAAYEKKLAEAKAHKEELEKSKAEAEALIAQYTKQKNDIEAYIEELDLSLNELSLSIFELDENISATEAELEKTKLDLEAARAREAEQYATMKARVQYIYENGETTYLDVILNAGSISDILNQFEYVSNIQKYDNSMLERLEIARQEVADHEQLLEATLDSLQTMRAEAEFERETMQELYDLKAAEIETLCKELGVADEYLFTYITELSAQNVEIDNIIAAEEKRVEEEEKRRKEEEERLRREEEARRLAEQRAAEAAKKNTTSKVYDKDAIKYIVQTDETDPYSMIWPLPGDHRTYSKFGYRKAPTKGASTYHQGWDIGGEFGAPIVATLAGTVKIAGYNASAGNYVKVEHQPGFMTVYCHLSKQLVSTGDYVKQGQTVGLCGSTGVSTAPHLHFAVSINGSYVDPNPYIGHLE